MSETTTSIQQLAAEAYDCFTTSTRDNGDVYFVLKDGSPEWVKDLVYAAHGGDFLPDDYRYRWTYGALEFIQDSDDPENDQAEFSDLAVDIYTGDRLAWLASNLNRPGYVDEAVNEFGYDGKEGIIGAIGIGQYAEASEVYGLVLKALEDVSAGVDC